MPDHEDSEGFYIEDEEDYPGKDDMPWESAARQAVAGHLAGLNWDEVDSVDDLTSELEWMAEDQGVAHEPYEGGQRVFSPGYDGIVEQELAEFESEVESARARESERFHGDELELADFDDVLKQEADNGSVQAEIKFAADKLINHLTKHPERIYEIDSGQFEELVAEIFAEFGYQVQLTKRTRDGGYDIIALRKDLKSGVMTSLLIECKRWSANRKIGVEVVRALYGIQTDERFSNVMLATTSFFTVEARKYKKSRYDLSPWLRWDSRAGTC